MIEVQFNLVMLNLNKYLLNNQERQYTLLILDEDAEKLNINDYYNFYTVFNDRGFFLWQEITFSSINDKISHSGLSVRQFIQQVPQVKVIVFLNILMIKN
ncbi:hypothetical protein [Spiroplasma citri]|uniref:hypothetical protein n=1 Tax=Spiroplasma citri TaxID=2133 RepID=UPI0011BBF9DF|nr:hypothetical protein [Spiroplasma citri]QED24648.1 hypothetical protein FRX96_04195 [Spiroplasma citri]